MKRAELTDRLRREMERWSRKSFEGLRRELDGRPNYYLSGEGATQYLTEVDVLIRTHDYLGVVMSVSDLMEPYCHGVSGGLKVYRNGRAESYVHGEQQRARRRRSQGDLLSDG